MDEQGADAELVARLEALEAEERQISAERRRLHDRLNAFHSEAGAQREVELSGRRRDLHRQIDALRAQLGRPPGPTRPPQEPEWPGTFWSQDDG